MAPLLKQSEHDLLLELCCIIIMHVAQGNCAIVNNVTSEKKLEIVSEYFLCYATYRLLKNLKKHHGVFTKLSVSNLCYANTI